MALTDIAKGLLGVLLLMAALLLCLFLRAPARPAARRRQGSDANQKRGPALQA